MRQLTTRDYCQLLDMVNIRSGGLYTLQELVYEMAMVASEIPPDEFYELGNIREYHDYVVSLMDLSVTQVSETPDGWTIRTPEFITRLPREPIECLELRYPRARDVMRPKGRPTQYASVPWADVWMVKELSDGILRLEDVLEFPMGLFLAIKATFDEYKALHFGVVDRN